MNSLKSKDLQENVLRAALTATSRCAVRLTLLSALVLNAGFTRAQTESVIHSFTGQPDGAYPSAGLVRDAKGNLYGTTYGGGAAGNGTVYEVIPTGKARVLYSFIGGADGSGPAAILIRANGSLYGTTVGGGPKFFGTVFKVTPAGLESVLAGFAMGDGGGFPEAGLIRDKQGNLYGTTSGYNGGYGNGAVFKVTSDGILTILYEFSGGGDGLCPYGGLVSDSQGNLYGTTYRGGAAGYGTVFEVAPDGKETVLHSFGGGIDGSLPAAGLLRDRAGNLYGTTTGGGTGGYGTVFRVAKTGTERVLHSFTGADGFYPIASLIEDPAGNLIGTTEFGGSHGEGTVFRVAKTGTVKVLYSFTGGPDGGSPTAALVLDTQGNLYGTTSGGGNSNCLGGCGVVFKLIP
jgi:uncharacterized repeat protein (TIGR03803 family)